MDLKAFKQKNASAASLASRHSSNETSSLTSSRKLTKLFSRSSRRRRAEEAAQQDELQSPITPSKEEQAISEKVALSLNPNVSTSALTSGSEPDDEDQR